MLARPVGRPPSRRASSTSTALRAHGSLATLDVDLALLRGLPVRLIGGGFLGLLALVTAESAQAVGTLLLVGLLAAPAGAAHRLTAWPYLGLALAAAIAVGCRWAGLALAYAIPSLPPSSAVIGLAGGACGMALLVTRRPTRS